MPKGSASASASVLPAFDLVENFHLGMGVGEEGGTHGEILSNKEGGVERALLNEKETHTGMGETVSEKQGQKESY